jgi:CHRD domain
VQMKPSLSDTNWINVVTTSNAGATVPKVGNVGFFRIQDKASTNVIALTASLNGASEIPAVTDTTGSGFGTFSLEGNKLTFNVTYSGLSGVATLAHIHGPAPSTGSAAPMVDMAPFSVGAFGTSGTIAGTTTLTDSQAADLKSGKTYFNIHTGAHGGGEIRGQIIPMLLKATLDGASEVPAVSTSATGSGSFTLIGVQLGFDVDYAGLSATATLAHIHGPAAPGATASPMVDYHSLMAELSF